MSEPGRATTVGGAGSEPGGARPDGQATSEQGGPSAGGNGPTTGEGAGADVASGEAPVGGVFQVDVRLWNGDAEVQIDGLTVPPGRLELPAGNHQVAALVDGQVIDVADLYPGVEQVDLVAPSPLPGLAIMVENQADARPQTGLPQADVVYEALAEGGITRFIALYLSGDAPVVGPVRSLRHYFAFFAAEYGADVVHIGGSPEGFAWRDAMSMAHLDESAGDPGVWRVRTRAAPHNAYTATEADRAFLRARGGQQTRRWGPLRFSHDAAETPAGADAAHAISLGFLRWAYQVDYQWDPASGRYSRSMDGTPHRDAASGEQIAPASVVVQFASMDDVAGDPKQRMDVSLIESAGDIVVFSGGTVRAGTWTKGAPTSPTDWWDRQGQRIILPPGQVWVELLPLGSPLRWS